MPTLNSPLVQPASPNSMGGRDRALRLMSQLWTTIPYPEISIPWTEAVRREPSSSYKSDKLLFEAETMRAEGSWKMQSTSWELEARHLNHLFETMVGEIIRIYVQKRGGAFYFASKHDDICNGVDYIISFDGIHYIGVDLVVTHCRLWDFEKTLQHETVAKKRMNFDQKNRIPQEFFSTVLRKRKKEPIPLIILRLPKHILNSLAQKFFSLYAQFSGKIEEVNLFEYYMDWVGSDSDMIPDRIAHILWLQKTEWTVGEFAHLESTSLELGRLFAGVEWVKMKTFED